MAPTLEDAALSIASLGLFRPNDRRLKEIMTS
jgi:hypothetical protein